MRKQIARTDPDPGRAHISLHSGIVYSQLLGDTAAPQCSAIPGNPRRRPLHLCMMVPNEPPAIPGRERVRRKMPVVVHLSGGGFELYEHMGTIPNLTWLCDAGYVVVDVEYRKSSESKFPGAVDDIKTAIRFLKTHAAHFDIDPDRIVTLGYSAGGYLSAFTAVSAAAPEFDVGEYPGVSSSVAAAVDFYGPIDFARLDEDDTIGSFIKHSDGRSPESQFLGAPLAEIPDRCEQANPLRYIAAGMPPVLILHGTADGDVPMRQSERLYEALTAAGNDAELILVEGASHGTHDHCWDNDEIHAAVIDFLNRHLA